MIKHIVLIKLNKYDKKILAEMSKLILSMDEKIPQICSLEVGVDKLHSERSYDIALTATFKSMEELEIYQNNTYHCDIVKKFIRQYSSSTIVIDYEI